ncbi:hypothetical protein RO3G_04940 [Rhizopus delemar RA 99-880]|uniref:Uncharacterized protein n=1 Tax=Rhizopus delemar (strain RA 99-880 / ATCC MYA-4621 / FGSC 9543 / NRRL 43880) TaxID=246409 RepID=I1BVK5_RHIO9|nr:hypothetical protein RO3G_04940 [Rhizopus delemar RA 99-880]|eukprot:EIE80235.1 hypothetical protein RO3G_04940 [Rhizopus delemar RA 99-880]
MVAQYPTLGTFILGRICFLLHWMQLKEENEEKYSHKKRRSPTVNMLTQNFVNRIPIEIRTTPC